MRYINCCLYGELTMKTATYNELQKKAWDIASYDPGNNLTNYSLVDVSPKDHSGNNVSGDVNSLVFDKVPNVGTVKNEYDRAASRKPEAWADLALSPVDAINSTPLGAAATDWLMGHGRHAWQTAALIPFALGFTADAMGARKVGNKLMDWSSKFDNWHGKNVHDYRMQLKRDQFGTTLPGDEDDYIVNSYKLIPGKKWSGLGDMSSAAAYLLTGFTGRMPWFRKGVWPVLKSPITLRNAVVREGARKLLSPATYAKYAPWAKRALDWASLAGGAVNAVAVAVPGAVEAINAGVTPVPDGLRTGVATSAAAINKHPVTKWVLPFFSPFYVSYLRGSSIDPATGQRRFTQAAGDAATYVTARPFSVFDNRRFYNPNVNTVRNLAQGKLQPNDVTRSMPKDTPLPHLSTYGAYRDLSKVLSEAEWTSDRMPDAYQNLPPEERVTLFQRMLPTVFKAVEAPEYYSNMAKDSANHYMYTE